MVTYLFGAGASANSIPVVNSFKDKITEIIKILNTTSGLLGHQLTPTEIKTKTQLIKLLKNIDLINYDSIDVFAKMKLHTISDPYSVNSEYMKVKYVIALVIYYSELTKGIDTRYLNFLTTIAKIEPGQFILPQDITFISWNYDTQFFGAIKMLKPGSTYSDALNCVSFEFLDPSVCQYYSLNGNVALKNKTSKKVEFDLTSLFPGATIQRKLINFYNELMDNEIDLDLGFIWEKLMVGKTLRHLKFADRLKNCSALVVVGYSFPFFNKEVDSMILNCFTSRRIYIQCLEKDFEPIVQRITALTQIPLRSLPHFKESISFIEGEKRPFFIPSEISLT